MSEILLYYKRPDPTTWVYLSSFLTIGLFFVFHRFWSIRNLDIALLIMLSPGLLMVHKGRELELAEIAREETRQEQETTLKKLSNANTTVPTMAVTKFGSPNEADSGGSDPESEKQEKSGVQTVQDTTDASILPSQMQDSETKASNSALAQDRENEATNTGTNQGDTASKEDSESEESTISPDDSIALTEALSVADPREGLSPESMISEGEYSSQQVQRWGFIYLLLIQGFILLRLMLDPIMSRRPLLDPNLTTGGLNFIGISLFIFMMANVVDSSPRIQVSQGPELGPGYALMRMLPAIPTRPVENQLGEASAASAKETQLTSSQQRLATIAKVLAILAHLAIVSGIVLISNRHFSNLRAGVGCATLYLMLPYTAQMTGRVDHALPAALLLWAVLCYRKPFLSGIFLGLAGGLVYYPLFLLPLWFSFYWQFGVRKFAVGTISMLAALMLALSLDDSSTLPDNLAHMFGVLHPDRPAESMRGLWALGWNPIWRLPVIVAFVILSAFFAIWPAQKNLGTLLSGSAALMVAAQFWHGESGGIYIAWFLPLLLLTIFRPNLQDRVASKVVVGGKAALGSRSELEAV